MTKICNEKQPFERVVITKADAEALFAHNPFKLAIIKSKLPDNAATTVYRCFPDRAHCLCSCGLLGL